MHFVVPSCVMVYVILILLMPGDVSPQMAGHMDGFDSNSVPFRTGISRNPPSAQPISKTPSEYTRQFTCTKGREQESLEMAVHRRSDTRGLPDNTYGDSERNGALSPQNTTLQGERCNFASGKSCEQIDLSSFGAPL